MIGKATELELWDFIPAIEFIIPPDVQIRSIMIRLRIKKKKDINEKMLKQLQHF